MIKKLLTTFTFIFATSLCAMEAPVPMEIEQAEFAIKSLKQQCYQTMAPHALKYSVNDIANLPQETRTPLVIQALQAQLGSLEDPVVATCTGHNGTMYGLSHTHDYTKIISCSADGTARVWDRQTGKELACLKHHDRAWVNCAAVTEDNRIIVTGASDGIYVWGLTTRTLQSFYPTDRAVEPLCISKDDKNVVFAVHNTVHVWEIATGNEICGCQGHLDRIVDLWLSDDGTQIYTTSDDGTGRLWSRATGQEIYQVPYVQEDYEPIVAAHAFAAQATAGNTIEIIDHSMLERLQGMSREQAKTIWAYLQGMSLVRVKKNDAWSYIYGVLTRTAEDNLAKEPVCKRLKRHAK